MGFAKTLWSWGEVLFFLVARLISALFQGIFGDVRWTAPIWARWLGRRIQSWFRVIGRHRRLATIIVVGLLLLSTGGWYAWKWWQSRPKPEVASFTVTAPAITDYANEAQPNPLRVEFDTSVAPLAKVGKDIANDSDKAAGELIKMTPAFKGVWRWEDDRTLAMTPAADWPIATEYALRFNKKLFASQIHLKTDEGRFRTPAFTAHVERSEFYQDPTNPVARKAVFELGFSHPVNKAELEKRIELRLAGQSDGVWGIGKERTRFSVSYDKFGLAAYVHSEPLSSPNDDSSIRLVLAKGLVAQADGVATEKSVESDLRVPGRNSLAINELSTNIAQNSKGDPEHLILVSLSATTTELALQKSVEAWVLPIFHPDTKAEDRTEPYGWGNPEEISDAVLKDATKLDLQLIPGEREHSEQQAFRYDAPVGRYVYFQVNAGLESFGGYRLPKRFQRILVIPAFPPQLNIVGQGALLTMSGERKIAVLSRDLPGVEVELGRVLPAQLQHLISQSDGDFGSPRFFGSFGMDNRDERLEMKMPINERRAGQANYEAVDLGGYLKQDGVEKRGIFLMNVRGYDPKREPTGTAASAVANEEASEPQQEAEESVAPESIGDMRLILVTDLGILVKRALDGTQDVFVQSIHTGSPVEGAQVEVIGRNGIALMTRTTGADGHVQFAQLDGLKRERAPLMYLVHKAGDTSFLPLNRSDRGLDFSRFDVGGKRNSVNPGQLTAHLFSERGLYRPGDIIHVGTIVKAQNWAASTNGLPMEIEVTDPRGLTVKRETFNLAAGGFNEFSHTTLENSPTGHYQINLYLVGDGARQTLIGSTGVKVQEFLPDRMKISAHLSSEAADGWVSPESLSATIDVQNLFGTPAAGRRVEASMTLSPSFPSFRAFPDYQFHDPLYAKQGFTDTLNESKTDDDGVAKFDLDLARFERATYRLYLLAKAFEPEGGRSVAADVSTLVSELAYMVGFKPDGDLSYVSRGAKRLVDVVAVDPEVRRLAIKDLRLELVERRYVSVLAKQNNGTYKYESRPKEILISERPFDISATKTTLALESGGPGNFFYRIKTPEGLQLSRIEYSVAGDGNVTRSLERNAELQIALKKRDVAPGEELEVSIRAPYTGAGLITIERDHDYAYQWFKADENASVQKIRVPADFEGNGYVTVQYIRDAASDEIYMSPLSYGTVPFAVNRDARTNTLKLNAPEKIKLGQKLTMHLSSSEPSRVVVFAVDEGILQVARYTLANPLDDFFEKRSLDVRTQQILDLILPEFHKLMPSAAPGGDEEGALAKNLNPFKRKREKPAVYWSGIVDVQGERDFSYTVPDTFNGSLRLMAVSASDKTIGVVQGKTIVQGDFVLLPNVPLAVAPGDEFEVSVGVANNVAGSGKLAPVSLSLTVPPGLQAVGAVKQALTIREGGEATAIFRLRVRDGVEARLGSAAIGFTAWLDDSKIPGRGAKLTTDVSVRPATPLYTQVRIGSFKKSLELPVQRTMHTEHRVAKAAISPLPLVLAQGLTLYLENFSHQCTEQVTSRVLPAIVLGQRNDFLARQMTGNDVQNGIDKAIRVLRSRQNAEGGFGLWTASVQADEYASAYAIHMLIEARDRGYAVPPDLLQKNMSYLTGLATSHADSINAARTRAYAIYLLTRQGKVMSAQLASLREGLDTQFEATWQQDSVASFLAATYRLMKDERQANALMDLRVAALSKPGDWFPFANYYDPLVRDAQTMYLLARHFPERARKISFDALAEVLKPLQDGRFNTHSAAYVILALDAWASASGNTADLKLSISETDAKGKTTLAPAASGFVARAAISATATKLHFESDSDLTNYYSVTEAGFDRQPPSNELKSGLELVREYVDSTGEEVKTVKVGDEITVRLRFRAIGRSGISSAVLVDLMPGGFEPVLPASATTADDGGWTDPIAVGGNWKPDYGDAREDRIVLYGSIWPGDVQEYQYRIRATNAGAFVVPPAFGESMYERDIQGRSLPAAIKVERVK